MLWNLENVQDLSDVADAYGVQIGILIEVNTSMGRAGVRSPEEGVAIAKLATQLPGVKFQGVMSHQSLTEFENEAQRYAVGRETIQICLDVKTAIEAEDIPVEVVSTGETFTIDVATTMNGITEIEGGTYALGGTNYFYMKDFQIANKVLGTIISTPRPGVAIGDIGLMALSASGAALVENMPEIEVLEILDDHIVLTDVKTELQVGDTFTVIPSYQDMLIDRWDHYVAIRDGVVEEIWDIPGRGCSQ